MKIACSLMLALALPVFAAQNTARPAARAQAAPQPTGFKAEFFANLDDVEDKIMHLAESVPADKYGWRPASDVRSISEVFMHIAGSNYFLATFVGADSPKLNGDLEKSVTRKADVIAELRRSFEHLRNVVNTTSDLERSVKMFGNQTTRRGVLVTILSHLHEHLGQSIAYARMNGVIPPWSR